jgi:hypothetical protein
MAPGTTPEQYSKKLRAGTVRPTTIRLTDIALNFLRAHEGATGPAERAEPTSRELLP